MFHYVWPIVLIVVCNVAYQICAKSVSDHVNSFASLSVTYLVGAVVSAVLYYITERPANLIKEITKMNWATFVLGLTIVGLEAGFLYAYKAGWQVSTASIVQSSFLAVALIFTGAILYHEPITWNKALGVLICLVGLVFINWK